MNIPKVMTNFIPRHSTLITSEEQMLLMLREAAQDLDTRLERVGWLEAGQLTPDVLQRFPYDEHPYNIALVLRLGQELGDALIKAHGAKPVLLATQQPSAAGAFFRNQSAADFYLDSGR